ncbi:MAG: heat-inducible transcription repressor HrcA [Desulfovibrionaceae bacterium]|nr:heat-inducible transcription repressor HrcA [Desulfovibrionaceae bacterium]
MSQLSSRNLQVLGSIIEEYINTAAPVGSKAVAGHSCLGLSPATIRNCMAELTELGLLEQPHTSAGRVPTNRAFRIYIDSLLTLRPLESHTATSISDLMYNDDLEINEVFRRAAGIVAEHCHQVSMLLTPRPQSSRWSCIGFAPAGKRKVMAMLALEGGQVETRMLDTESDYSADELINFGNYLNAHFKGMTLLAARQALAEELSCVERRLENIFQQALALAAQTINSVKEERKLFVDGTSSIFEQAEFASLESAREIFVFLEERNRLLELLDATLSSPSVQVSFYDQNNDLPGCSIVSSAYGAPHTEGGVVSILGPSRMNYSQVMPVITCISDALTRILQARA